MINIVVADDQLLFRKGIVALLETFDNVHVCVEASNGQELIDKMDACGVVVHVALIDISMPVMNGIDTMAMMRRKYPQTKNIILTVHEEDKFIQKLIDEGANAYLAKNSEPAEVERAIHAVVQHDYYFNEHTIRVMRNSNDVGRRKKKVSPFVEDLTYREKEILQFICGELTSPEIAEKLFLSESTVNGHRNNLLMKTGARNTAGLVLFAIKNNLFDMDFK